MKATIIAATAIAMASSPTYAATTNLDNIESAVFQTTGDHQAITKRALTCINQIIKPGFIDAPTAKSSDLDAGIIVVNNGFETNVGMASIMLRTILTFEARDVRFKITHTGIEQFLGPPYGWVKVWVQWGSGYKHINEDTQKISSKLADCIMNANPTSNW